MVPLLVTVPLALPGDVCIEVLWELIHSPVISDSDRPQLIERLAPMCRNNLVPLPHDRESMRAPEIVPVFGRM